MNVKLIININLKRCLLFCVILMLQIYGLKYPLECGGDFSSLNQKKRGVITYNRNAFWIITYCFQPSRITCNIFSYCSGYWFTYWLRSVFCWKYQITFKNIIKFFNYFIIINNLNYKLYSLNEEANVIQTIITRIKLYLTSECTYLYFFICIGRTLRF